MHTFPLTSNSETAVKIRSIVFVLLGVAVLLLKQHYAGPLHEVVRAYAGNLSVSFALYFVFTNLRFPTRIRRLVAALFAFAAVELFEAFDGFGVMSNTYDPIDFLVNPIGIALGFWLDTKLGTVRTVDAKTNRS
jgi:hypothetical protein